MNEDPKALKPLLLLDVDGALSPYRMPDEPGVSWGCSRIFGFQMPLHPNLRSWLQHLAEEFALVWCSTWDAEGLAELAVHLALPANMAIVPNGSSATVHPDPSEDDGESERTSKLFYVEHWLRENDFEGRQLAWIDDRLGTDAFAWAAERSAPTLLVHTDRDYGITAADVAKLEMFALSPELVQEKAR